MGAWDELLKTEGEIRKKRQRMIYEQKERQRQVIEWDDCYWYRTCWWIFSLVDWLDLQTQGVL